MARLTKRLLVAGLLVLVIPALAFAVKTNITVRVRAHDAKFVGTAVAGVQVVVTDAISGKVLASGVLMGGTGDTKTLMKKPYARGGRLSNKATASYVAHLNLQHPTKIKVSVRGPLAGGNDIQEMSRTLWVLPGHHIDGDGLIFELYGLIVYPTVPGPHHFYKRGSKLTLTARVDMMCGCPIKVNGIWNAAQYKVKAYILQKGKTIATVPLTFTGKTSLYSATYSPPAPGNYKVMVTASDDVAHNYGVGFTGFVIKKK